MRASLWLSTAIVAMLPGFVLAQTVPAVPAKPVGTRTEAQVPTTAPAVRPDAADIIVRGTRERRSSWQKAETSHLIIYSNGSESDLRRVAANLEREYYLMSRVFGRDDTADDTIKLRITLIGDSDFMNHMRLSNARSAEGPYAEPFNDERYYDPRADGAVLAVSRSDLYFDLVPDQPLGEMDGFDYDTGPGFGDTTDDGNLGFNADPTVTPRVLGIAALGGGNGGKQKPPPPPPEVRPWESAVYAGFAQHFMLTYYPAAYPRWYLDGIGALFATLQFRKDGAIEYGRAPDDFRRVMAAYGEMDLGRVLTGRGTLNRTGMGWSPYHAWLLAHYFFFADLPTDRRVQFVKYMSAVAAGQPLTQAAAIFGDLRKLQSDVSSYGQGKTYFQTVPVPADRDVDPLIVRLTMSEAALLKARVELGARLEIPDPAAPGASARDAARAERARATAIVRRDKFLADLRAQVAKLPYNRAALLLLAEAECRTDHADACAAAASAVLTKEPNDSAALAWLGFAEIARAKMAPSDARAAAFAEARKTIGRANRSNTDAVLPMIAYFDSFVDAGQSAPDLALLGMLKAIQQVPASPELRLTLGEELARAGHKDAARTIMMPVLYSGYASPEQGRAQQVVGSPPAAITGSTAPR